MEFKTAFEHYKNKIATAEEIVYVEQELEKNRLISEYLERDDFEIDLEKMEVNTVEFKRVKRSLRYRTRNIIALSVVIVITLAVVAFYLAPPLFNGIFYDPQESTVSKNDSDFNLSMAAYTELFFPGYVYSNTDVEQTGIGKYDLTLTRFNLETNELEYTVASLNKNKLNVPKGFTSGSMLSLGIFARDSIEDSSSNLNEDSQEQFVKALSTLPDYIYVTAAVSFREDLSMTQLADLISSSSGISFQWAAVRRCAEDEPQYPLCGMSLGTISYFQDVNDKYPVFSYAALSQDGDYSADDYENHFISLVQYSVDHSGDLGLLDDTTGESDLTYYQSVLKYVKKNGVKTYGVIVKGTAADVLALLDNSEVLQLIPQSTSLEY